MRSVPSTPLRAGAALRTTGIALLAVLGGLATAAAQQPVQPQPQQQPQPRTDNPSNLRAIPEGPGKRVAELQGLDKVTARTQRFYAPVGETTRFGTLDIKVGDCLVNTPDAPPESAAYLTIIDHKPGQPEQKLFAGWMFASTPALSAMDDGVYDVRVLACTMAQGSSPPK
ncbi:MAG: DUF2155 domain-containing protein [Proteobacteria bacterium]|nr:DUF2155 domain-containing protein [Pseudomonadota bacterium]